MKDSRDQHITPFLDAMIDYVSSNPTPFDVPGHKLGSFKTDLSRKICDEFSSYDVNAPLGLDNLYNSTGVIKEAEALAAEACHADHCLFSVNGTTGGILSIIMACLNVKDKIILPRNVHKSVINALIISGAIPIFVSPIIDQKLGVACGVSTETYIKAMDENPTAKAVFVINPTYFGVVCDLKRVVEEAHKRNLIVICDEAHGSNFYFSKQLPISAMDAGADITAMSMHKNSGSLTQTSFILTKGDRINYSEVKRAFAMFSSTSPYHILIASLDAARKEMAIHGEEIIQSNLDLAIYARAKLNKIKGIHVYGKEYIDTHHTDGVYDIDLTKLVIDVRGLGLYGYEVYKRIRKEYNVQLELGEVSVVLAIIGPGTTLEHINRLIESFQRLSDEIESSPIKQIPDFNYSFPTTFVPPREAYDAPHSVIPLSDCLGEISAETIMAYPPGIPVVIPGEFITHDALNLIKFYSEEGGEVLKDTEPGMIKIIDRENWYLTEELEKKQ